MTCKTKDCIHESNISGDCHIECVNPKIDKLRNRLLNEMVTMALSGPVLWEAKRIMGVEGIDTGIKNGWFNWPFNFDVVWLEKCDSFEVKEE